MERVAICTYRPKPGKKDELLSILDEHVPTLRMAGLATMHPRSVSFAENGIVVEIFAWESDEAARAAHDNPDVQEIWQKIGKVADVVSLADIPETKKPFAHFTLAPNKRTNRVAHFHLMADDPERAAKFYRAVFDWEVNKFADTFWFCDTGKEPATGIDGGIIPRTKKDDPRGTSNVVFVDDLDEQIKKIEKAGGKIVLPKMAIEGVGWQAFATDTEGNTFGIFQSN